MKNFSIIVAVGKNRVIGNMGKMLWDIPEDLQNFRRLTMGNVIVMGRKTRLSIGKVLDGRENVILTRDSSYKASDSVVLHSIGEVIEKYGDKPVFVIGGGEIFRQFLPLVDFLYITYIDCEFIGDTYFAEFDINDWELIYKRLGKYTKEVGYDYYFTKYKRKI